MKHKLLLLITLVIFSCSGIEEVEPYGQIQLNTPSLVTQNDKIARNFTSALVQAIEFKEVRELINNKISLQFDGDNDVLIAQLLNEQLEGLDITFGELILSRTNSGPRSIEPKMTSNEAPLNLLDSISAFYPLLQISIPDLPNISADNWNGIEILPIAVVPEKIEGDQVPVILPSGEITSYSASTPPNELTMVVGRNERVIALPRKNLSYSASINDPGLDCEGDPFLSDSNNDYILLTDYYDAQNDCTIISQPGGGSGGSTNTSCDRDINNNKDRILGLKYKDINNYRRDMDDDNGDDAWFNGGLEVHVEIRFGQSNGSISKLTKVFTGDRGAWRECGFLWTNCKTIWYNTNAEIVTWNKNIYGDAMHYVWYEFDGGGTRTETITWTSNIGDVPVELTDTRVVNINDDALGESIVEYCDDTGNGGYTYDTNDLLFKVGQ